MWQSGIVKEYAREDQFITHNFDFEWKGYSYGVQPMVDHVHAARALTVAGCDIYHPTQDYLTGTEIAFGGDLTRSLKKDNYFVLETEAQGFPQWTPYDGQLRLQAFSHLASGANMVEYWHWHSIHNSFETYWKGLLSHDFKENETYRAAKQIGREFAGLGPHLINLKKHNRVALLLSNESLTALDWFPIRENEDGSKFRYNDVVRYIYDALYEMNVECDILWPESEELSDYDLLILPALYTADEKLLLRIADYVEQGGHLLATFKTAFTDENVKVYSDVQPHILNRCFGVSYSHFTYPNHLQLATDHYSCGEKEVRGFLELLNVEQNGVQVLATYDHPSWGRFAAVTCNTCGKGTATYLGCQTTKAMLKEILRDTLNDAGIADTADRPEFPVIIRTGINQFGKEIIYYLNYSPKEQIVTYQGIDGVELFGDTPVKEGETLHIPAWDLKIIER